MGRVAPSSNGYAKLYNPTTGKNERAHRYVFEKAFGPIPIGLVVMHTCDNRACTNLHHLVLDTQSENLKDMYRKGRQGERNLPRGQVHHNATLSDEIAIEIRNTTYKRGVYTVLANKYNVTRQTISNIMKNKTRSKNAFQYRCRD